MKSDREFLNGVYHKSEELKQIDSKRHQFAFTRKYKGLIVAAALTLVIAPSLYFSTLPTMKNQIEDNNQIPQVARLRDFVDIREAIKQADIIVRAKVTDIDKGVYENNNITTAVELHPKEIYKGTLEDKTIQLIVDGGFDNATKTYFEYEAIFKRNEDTLLFLTKINDKYILTFSSQGKYTYLKTYGKDRTYKSSDGEILTISELKKLIEKGR
ncbi:hypothetical protein LGK97_13750 [Clostridium sp. CS001]|uniref:hypothetical protein n=1 Tax=Clostridium sp. CS001 TaxID=2880648 RepID=UPI001CF4A1FA|nr:hypothetical protein [Clostridium sp. CS001]MCB2290805.1 hypothetical protein [Clostridium sp. CS001]